MQIEHHGNEDCVYIRMSNKRHGYSIEVDESRFVDYADDGTPIGIELLYASMGVDISDLPLADEVEKLLKDNGIKVLR